MLKELLVRQAELNSGLDLDNAEPQIVVPAGEEENAGGKADAPAGEPAVVDAVSEGFQACKARPRKEIGLESRLAELCRGLPFIV